MKIILLSVIFILSCSIGRAQDELVIPFLASWKKGEVKNYRIIKRSVQTRDSTEVSRQEMGYEAQLTVIKANAKGYTMEWKYVGGLTDLPNIPGQAGILADIPDISTIVYRTDRTGSFLEVVNWKEISEMVDAVFAKLTVNMGDSSPELMSVIKDIKDAIAGREGIEQLLLKEIVAFHNPLGLEMNVKDTLYYVSTLPNFFGGAPINGIGRFYIESVDKDNFTGTLASKMEIDSADFVQAMQDFAANMLARMENSSREEREKARHNLDSIFSGLKVDIHDDDSYTCYYYHCWPKFIHTCRTSTVGNAVFSMCRKEEIIIEEIE
ncbi:MAG: hypothetical protein ACOYXB_06555 [Bacteroidota bacterium]